MADTKIKGALIVGFLAVATVIALWVGSWIYITDRYSTPTDRGTFGDMFGAVNALFSGLAFVGLAIAIWIQREEIRVAKQDAAYTKEILDKQQEHLSFQNKETKRQTFENTFFQMLRLLTDITSNMDVGGTKGKDVFLNFTREIHLFYFNTGLSDPRHHNFNESYKNFYEGHSSDLGHYFRMLYNIVKFINRSEMEDKKFYSNILRAQLSDAEVTILFYNGLWNKGVDKLKPLIEEYALLKNIIDKDLIDKKLKERYLPSAYL